MYIKAFELGLIPLRESLRANLPGFQSSQAAGHSQHLYLQNPPGDPAHPLQSLEKAGSQLCLRPV